MSISDLGGHPISITLEGTEELPILYANAFFLQASGDGMFILTAAQAAPPIFSGKPDEQTQKLLEVETITGKPLVRIAMSAAKFRELVGVLQGILATQEEMMTKGGRDGTQ